MEEKRKVETRIVTAPGTIGVMIPGQMLSVEVSADEDVEWVWDHDRERGSSVTGYRIVPKPKKLTESERS